MQSFSHSANAWKQIEATHLSYKKCYTYKDNQAGSFLNGAIHWLAYSCELWCTCTNESYCCLWCNRNTSVRLFWYGNYRLCHLRVLRELLSLNVVGISLQYKYGWWNNTKCGLLGLKTIAVSVDHIPTQNQYFFPIFYTKSGDTVGEMLWQRTVERAWILL